MSCTNCKQTHPIPSWVHELVVGTISDANEDVYVIFKDITSGRKTIYPATSSNTGLVKLELEDIMWPENHSYEMSVAKDIGGNEGVSVTIDGDAYSCVGARFEKLRSESGDIETVLTYTISMA